MIRELRREASDRQIRRGVLYCRISCRRSEDANFVAAIDEIFREAPRIRAQAADGWPEFVAEQSDSHALGL